MRCTLQSVRFSSAVFAALTTALLTMAASPALATTPLKVLPDQIAPNQSAGEASVSPFLANARLEPTDTSKAVTFNISNASGESENFSVSALDFGTLNDTGGLAFSGSSITSFTRQHGLVNWLQLSPVHLTILPGQTIPITATITNAPDLGPGGHYAAIVMTRDAPDVGSSSTVTVQQKISALLFVTKAGGEDYDMTLTQIAHDGGWQHLPSYETLTFKNTGNTQVVPRGSIQVLNPRGDIVAEGIINQASAYVLPDSARQLLVQPQFIASAWLPGRYKLAVNYRYDGHDQFATRTVSFTYWNPLDLALPGVVLMLGSAAFRFRRSRPVKAVLRFESHGMLDKFVKHLPGRR